jgi:hypothetical protein
MWYVVRWLFPAVALTWLPACLARPISPIGGADRLYIFNDEGRLSARLGSSPIPIEDCSDRKLRCFKVPDRFFFAFPKRCPADAAYDNLRWSVAGVQTSFLLVDPESGAPSGGYISSFSDKVLYHYDIKRGLFRIVVAKRSLLTPDSNPGDRERVIEVEFDRSTLNSFICER